MSWVPSKQSLRWGFLFEQFTEKALRREGVGGVGQAGPDSARGPASPLQQRRNGAEGADHLPGLCVFSLRNVGWDFGDCLVEQMGGNERVQVT